MSLLHLLFVVVALVLLFALSAFFSGSETVMFSLSPMQIQRIRKRDSAAGDRIEKLLGSPSSLLAALLVANSFVNFAIATLGYLALERIVPRFAGTIAVPLMTLLLLLFGEVAPKRIATVRAERMAPFCSAVMVWLVRLCKPISFALEASTHLFNRKAKPEKPALTNKELLTAVEMSAQQGVLDEQDVSMVEGIMLLPLRHASDEMTPRVDMTWLDLEDPTEKNIATAKRAGHRVLPVCRRSPDAVEGVVDVVRYLLDPEHSLRSAMSTPLFVPESMPLDKLLLKFQTSGSHLAVVADEYGGTAGVITRGDILELVADPVIPDEEDEEEMRKTGEDTWTVAGTAGIDEFNLETGTKLVAEGSDRMGGWIAHHAGKIPRPGLQVEAQNVRATVLAMRKRRVAFASIEVLKREQDDAEEKLLESDGQ